MYSSAAHLSDSDTKIRLLTLNRQTYLLSKIGRTIKTSLAASLWWSHNSLIRRCPSPSFSITTLYFFIYHTLLLLSPTFSPPILSQLSRVAVFSSVPRHSAPGIFLARGSGTIPNMACTVRRLDHQVYGLYMFGLS